MPISRYPRSGHPIAPSLLSPFLRRRVPKFGVRFVDLDATAWDKLGESICRKLGRTLVQYLATQLDDIKARLGSHAITPIETHLRLEQLDLETRTFNCLKKIRIDERPAGIAGLTIRESLEISSFGIKSLVDLLTSVEAAVAKGECSDLQSDQLHRVESDVLPRNCCEVIRRSSYIFKWMADLRVPPPPRGIKLKQMGLRARTYNALRKAGYHKDPCRIGELTLREILRLPHFGIESLCDLVESVERFEQSRYPLLSPRPRERDESRVLLEFLRERNIPEWVLARNLPALPTGTQIDDLQLKKRTEHLLERDGFANDLQRLTQLTVGSLTQLQGFGRVSIINLMENICRLRESAISSVKAMASTRREISGIVEKICAIPGAFGIDRSDPRLGRLLRRVDSTACVIGDLTVSLENTTISSRRAELQQLREAMQQCTQLTVESELVDLIVGKHASARNADVVAEYYGFRGRPLGTLQVVGDKYELTRERVRQICAPTRIGKLPRPPFAPVIDSALALIRRVIPAARSSVERELVENRITEPGTSLQSVIRVAQFLRRHTDFECVGEGDWVLPNAQADYLKRIEQVARKLVRRFGAGDVHDVVERSRISLADDKAIELVTIAVSSMKGFRWLDEGTGWFGFGSTHPTRLPRRIRKVLSVCPDIDIGELRTAIRRDYLLQGRVPPRAILLELCRQIDGVRIEGDRVMSTMSENPATLLKGAEATVVGLLLEHGPVCRREELQERALALGMGVPSFWRCVQFSPMIARYAPGVYGLTGAQVRPELIESLCRKRSGRRVIQDHGWTNDGRVWVAYQISPAAIDTGVVGIPAGKRGLIQGEFQLILANGEQVGTLIVKDSNAWGMGPFLRRRGAEPDDYLLIVFDMSKRHATIKIGDAGLLDEFQAAV